MSRLRYTFTLLRYVHDVATGEFVNVGVVLHGAAGNFLGAKVSHRTHRIAQFFPDAASQGIKKTLTFIEGRINRLGRDLSKSDTQRLELESVDALALAQRVLKKDDSALQWSPVSVGLTASFQSTLDRLFERYVARYETQKTRMTRTDDQVWKSFEHALVSHEVNAFIQEHEIRSPVETVCFKRAVKNGRWNVLEPMSFDLQDGEWIRNKAKQMLGQITGLKESGEDFRVFMLLGEPTRPGVQKDYLSARRYLERLPVDHAIYTEQETGAFAEDLRVIAEHAQI